MLCCVCPEGRFFMSEEERRTSIGPALARVNKIETFGSVDGPGVRFVVFLQGCRFRCRYCHNPDTWADETEETTYQSAEELLAFAKRYRSYWGTKGGITVSGGEPLLQMEFLIDFFTKAKAEGIHTCIDTAGGPYEEDGPWKEDFIKLMAVTDLLLVDIKHIDPEEHVKLTGQRNDNVLSMLRCLDAIHKPVWIRHVLVPGITDNDEYLKRTRAFLDTLTNVQRVEVLPYHTMAIPKWEKLGIPYTLTGTESPTQERIDNARSILGAI